jgi:hypothetical protein
LEFVFSERSDLEIELVEVGNIITVDLYLGVINKGDEKMIDATRAKTVTIINGFLQ